MKINSYNVNKAVSLIELATDGLNRIKELVLSHKEITDDDWMRSAAPLNELQNLINTQELEQNLLNCSQCNFYSKEIMVCMNPLNKGIRIFNPDITSCDFATEK